MPPDPQRVPGPLDPVGRLPHGAHLPTVQIELSYVDDRLVAQLDHPQAGAGVRRRALLAGAHHRRGPRVPDGVRQPRLDRRCPRLGRAERVTGGERDPGHLPVGHRGLAGRREHHGLVPPGGEVPQRVLVAVLGEQGADPPLLVHRQRRDRPLRAEQHVQRREQRDRAEQPEDEVDRAGRPAFLPDVEHAAGDHLAGRVPEPLDAARYRPRERLHQRPAGEGEHDEQARQGQQRLGQAGPLDPGVELAGGQLQYGQEADHERGMQGDQRQPVRT